ncbi:DUF1648 domain-containing protein [Clostridium sp. LBM24168]
MRENLYMSLYMLFIFIIILIIEMLTPKFTRKEIIFGVRIPEDKIDLKEIEDIKKKYVKNNLLIGIPVIVLFSIMNYIFFSIGMILFTVFGFLFIGFLIYLVSNRNVKRLKQRENWFKGKKQFVTIDTDFSKEKVNSIVSSWLFLIPIIIILVNIILGYTHYDLLPHRVATNWDFSGNITGYQDKSSFLIWEMPLAQLVCTAIFFIIYKSIGWSKQQINSSNPRASVEKNKIFRKVWSIYMVIYCILTDILLTMGTVQIFKIFNISSIFYTIVIVVFLILIFLSIIILSVKLGQGGANIKFPDEDNKNKFPRENRDDDIYWKLGNTIYYNPDDPSVFIEKRFGVGWTINAGRPLGMAVYIGMILFIIIVMTVVRFLKN